MITYCFTDSLIASDSGAGREQCKFRLKFHGTEHRLERGHCIQRVSATCKLRKLGGDVLPGALNRGRVDLGTRNLVHATQRRAKGHRDLTVAWENHVGIHRLGGETATLQRRWNIDQNVIDKCMRRRTTAIVVIVARIRNSKEDVLDDSLHFKNPSTITHKKSSVNELWIDLDDVEPSAHITSTGPNRQPLETQEGRIGRKITYQETAKCTSLRTRYVCGKAERHRQVYLDAILKKEI